MRLFVSRRRTHIVETQLVYILRDDACQLAYCCADDERLSGIWIMNAKCFFFHFINNKIEGNVQRYPYVCSKLRWNDPHASCCCIAMQENCTINFFAKSRDFNSIEVESKHYRKFYGGNIGKSKIYCPGNAQFEAGDPNQRAMITITEKLGLTKKCRIYSNEEDAFQHRGNRPTDQPTIFQTIFICIFIFVCSLILFVCNCKVHGARAMSASSLRIFKTNFIVRKKSFVACCCCLCYCYYCVRM